MRLTSCQQHASISQFVNQGEVIMWWMQLMDQVRGWVARG